MRRLAAAALTGVLLLSAGCFTDRSAPPAGTTPPVPAAGSSANTGSAAPGGAGATSGDGAPAGNTAAICDQAARTGRNFAATFAQNLKLQIDASSSQDRARVAKVEEKTSRDVDNYSTALTDMSRVVDDPAVKKALAGMGRQVKSLKGDVRALDEGLLSDLGATLDEACGRS